MPQVTLAVSDHPTRVLFGGAYVVDSTSLILKALFLVTGYVVVLLSTNYVADEDFWESEYYTLMVASVIGMTVMASARDMITIFVALELLSIPAYMLAAWRKRDEKSNEAGMKYYLMGVFASAILLYGMSLVYGLTGETQLTEIAKQASIARTPALTMAIAFIVIGFGFKVSAVPFHMWAPDTYEGAPTPVTAFLAVASKAAGFVALIQVLSIAFSQNVSVVKPLVAVLSALTMTVGNLIALRQTNIVRMLAYSGIAQAGFMLAPFVVVERGQAVSAIVVYLVLYAATNLGAFAVVIAASRTTRSGEISSYAGLFRTAPGLAVAMTVFLASFVGIPPVGAWYGKFGVMRVLMAAPGKYPLVLAIILAINTAIAAYYYLNVAKTMWFDEPTAGATTGVKVPTSLKIALTLTLTATMVLGVFPGIIDDAANYVPESAVTANP
jgi:NADH-quinone oxidoreductase subunit N